MPNLDKYQIKVVTSKENLLVIAGPGSGKTTTIIAKVNYLINDLHESKILLISFTNKSVEDIKKRLSTPNIDVMTFHKLAIDILKTYKINFKICDSTLLEYITDEYLATLSKEMTTKLCQSVDVLKIEKNTLEYNKLKKLIITFISIFKTNNHNFDIFKNIVKTYQDKNLLKIILDIFYKYEEEKQSLNVFDFDDLIVKATKLINTEYKYKNYNYIIIDEFQDTSLIRLNLIKAIYKNTNAIITAVGDDAQSIFHFSGCDLNIFLNFQEHFPNSSIVYLKNTYRNSQEIINISESFINKNPCQLRKNMQSPVHIKHPIKIINYFFPKHALKKLLNILSKENKDILIISRNYNDIYEYLDNDFRLEKDSLYYQNKKYRFLTIHSSKGLEADYVIILNVSNKKYGLPNKEINHPLINMLSSSCDTFPYAEERRVFFVAITRCKLKTFLLVPKSNPSTFIKEIKKHL